MSRRASGILSAPVRRMSSSVTTWIAAAVSESFSGFFDTDVTSMANNSSRLSFLSSLTDGSDSFVCAEADKANVMDAEVRTHKTGPRRRLCFQSSGEGEPKFPDDRPCTTPVLFSKVQIIMRPAAISSSRQAVVLGMLQNGDN